MCYSPFMLILKVICAVALTVAIFCLIWLGTDLPEEDR